MASPESTDVLIDAWREALIDAMAQQCAAWQRERALIEAQAAQTIAELRAKIVELERSHEGLLQQKFLEVEAKIFERLSKLRDGRDGASIIGPVGERGEKGLQGLPGSQGPRGLQGETGHGEKGQEGKEGKEGPRGEKGDSVKGERGEAGQQGPQGPQGQKGIDGRDGLSLIGPEGPCGEPGEPGQQGPQGQKGDDGRDGLSAIGPEGPRGEPGVPGARGERGEAGTKGDPGERGPAGAKGDTGPIGLKGEQGADGVPGKLPRVKLWQPETVFYDSDVVRHDRGTYQALKDTSQRPGSGEDWICIAAGGLDAQTPQVRGTFDSDIKYQALDIVAVNGGSFIARRDRPGDCPGDGWQLIARQGQRGIVGERGERGLPGEPGKILALKGWTIDRENFVAIPLMSDGSRGPTLELRGLFEQFQNDVG
jgi:hypothetical protein